MSKESILIRLPQRKIFVFAEEYLPRLGYKKRAHLMNPMVPGLAGGKMSASDPNSKIDFLDPPEVIRSKIKKAFCEEGNPDNGILAFVKAVLIPISQLRIERRQGVDGEEAKQATANQLPFITEDAPEGTVFTIARKGVETRHYKTFEEIEQDFIAKELHPGDLKAAVTEGITKILVPIQDAFKANEEWQKVCELAYPDPKADAAKKKKKVISRT